LSATVPAESVAPGARPAPEPALALGMDEPTTRGATCRLAPGGSWREQAAAKPNVNPNTNARTCSAAIIAALPAPSP
jgi:hypothetical protein